MSKDRAGYVYLSSRVIQYYQAFEVKNDFYCFAMEYLSMDLFEYKDEVLSQGYCTSIEDLQSIAYQLTDAYQCMSTSTTPIKPTD